MVELVALLRENGVQVVVDVRRFPGSRKNPQFQQENLKAGVQQATIEYLWFGESLGGFRTGGYQKYTESEGFQQGLVALEEIARQKITALLCAEKLFFRCHRRFIAEALVKRGWRVVHILDLGKTYEHRLREAIEGAEDQLALFPNKALGKLE